MIYKTVALMLMFVCVWLLGTKATAWVVFVLAGLALAFFVRLLVRLLYPEPKEPPAGQP